MMLKIATLVAFPQPRLLFITLLLGVSSHISMAATISTSTQAQFRLGLNTHIHTTDGGKGDRLQVSQFQLNPEMTIRTEDFGRFTSLFRIRHQTGGGLLNSNINYQGFGQASKPIDIGEKRTIELRELYWEKNIGNHYLTLGKQQIVWGKTDGLKLLDIVNPQSYIEFILEDFEESRSPLWSANVEFNTGENSTLQLLWIFDKSVHTLPTQEGLYAFSSPRIVPSAPENMNVITDNTIYPADLSNNIFKDFDYGAR